ncbi:HlyD family efflux transporter periplasmic adaptor subunit [Vulcanococcus sp.]|jgi:HlyD family secretion protein|uniref:HlyD family efflux transporter periplasmic adaptor subunit n=1 Tax=Vulcanococcus sp. TaxID=2856995 RepID=UPI0037DA49FC
MDRLTARPWLLAGGGALLLVLAGLALRPRPKPVPAPAPAPVVQPEAVSALGYLEPAGEVVELAAPSSGIAGSPRLSQLLVQEGQRVRRGQLLASFDNRPRLQADLAAVNARLQSLQAQIRLQRREVDRYSRAASTGAASLVLLEEKRDELVKLQGQWREALAQRQGVQVDLAQSELRAPLEATVLKIHAQVGERPGTKGVMELGASDQMEAVAEVYESDINRVRVGQSVRLTSENGGFSGTLQARVLRISPQVSQRQVLSTDPTGDADARVVEVRLALDPQAAAQVRNLAGLKLIARFTP